MALHFDRTEYARRIKATIAAMEKQGLDGLLMFQQESMYYLTGYDTFGFCFFQCLYLGNDGKLALLTRSADLRQAQHTSIIEDIRIWTDAAGAKPATQLRDMLQSLGARGKRLGIENQSYGLTHANGRQVDAALEGFARLQDASDLVNMIRVVKSPAELRYVRKAGELGDAALKAAVRKTRAGADEGEILAAQQGAVFAGGGDYPANEFIIGSGRDALLCRYKSGRRKLSKKDQLTLEWAGVYRHYHAAFMRTLIIGKPGKAHLAMDEACREALEAVEEQLVPGRTAGDVFAAHAAIMDAHGMKDHRLNACGYSLGAKFTPSWMDSPMFYKDNPVVIGPGMVFFAHMILMNSAAGAAYCLGRTYIIGEKKAEPVSKASLGMIIR
ncbi:aminopeptidase P family protein [Aestuariivirga litoralis]|uniref:Aminopeptidase P family protein n=1 Tax=Aestuariivirga litoralis TaxID=2650924 RepID=A0A2W2BDX3_9HYPH|nr:Xaa-Pro peptidase family protein [Aestuariivirga litoralis]PZF78408.1 aminopeptidase P family protein [Aestuariivirga litoralis]